MFPTIFALALRGLGAHTKIASSLLIMSIVGGAVAPLLMGIVADGHSMALGFVVPLVCFVVIAAYAISRPLGVIRPFLCSPRQAWLGH